MFTSFSLVPLCLMLTSTMKYFIYMWLPLKNFAKSWTFDRAAWWRN